MIYLLSTSDEEDVNHTVATGQSVCDDIMQIFSIGNHQNFCMQSSRRLEHGYICLFPSRKINKSDP